MKNPYKYKGPLDPVQDELVCIPREKKLNRIVEGLINGDYWAVIGPRQVGKTTLLRQIEKVFPQAYYVYIDFELSSSENDIFYRMLINEFQERIPTQKKQVINENWEGYGPELYFFNFLENFKPEDDKKKVILLFDEIGKITFVSDFLHLWRKAYHERYYKSGLRRYSVVLAGSVDLTPLTKGEKSASSPFNIAETYYVEDFSDDESLGLINEPMEKLNIEIEPAAKEKLIYYVSGHPQLLQHLCHILVDRIISGPGSRKIKVKDVDESIPILYKTNTALETLKQQIKINNILEDLLRGILAGEKKQYSLNKEYSTAGAGPIVERGLICGIRNEVYKRFIEGILSDSKYKSLSQLEKDLLKLNDKIEAELTKLKEYEEQIPYENDGFICDRCENELKRFKDRDKGYRIDLNQFSRQSDRQHEDLINNIENHLKKRAEKIQHVTHLLKQKNIHCYFLESDTHHIITNTLKFLEIEELVKIDIVLGAVNSGKIEEKTVHQVWSEIQFIISQINSGKISFTHHALLKEIKRLENETRSVSNAKLKIMLYLPIIPLLLANKKDIKSESLNIDRDISELGKKWQVLLERAN
jgi:hypothetical protein